MGHADRGPGRTGDLPAAQIILAGAAPTEGPSKGENHLRRARAEYALANGDTDAALAAAEDYAEHGRCPGPQPGPARICASTIRPGLGAAAVGPARRARDPLRQALDLLHGVESLTPSERRVAGLAADGTANKVIAQTLYVTPKTVELHLSSAYRKLRIRSRRELPAALVPR